MRVLAIYYTDPIEGRVKFVVEDPKDTVVEHYLWIADHLKDVPDGPSLGLFDARMIYPARGPVVETRLLDRDRVGTIRVEEIDTTPSKLWE